MSSIFHLILNIIWLWGIKTLGRQKKKKQEGRNTTQQFWNLNMIPLTCTWVFCSLFFRLFRKGCVVQRKVVETSSPPPLLLPKEKVQKHPSHCHEMCTIKGTYAEVAVTSCHPLAMFCLNSWSELIPSFRLISARCFSFAANTWDRVWISSSTYEEQGWGENTAKAAL